MLFRTFLKNLKMFDYTLKDLIPDLSADEAKILVDYPLTDKKQWIDIKYDKIKSRIKKQLYLRQFDRCAYCRKIIEGGAKYEPLDHLVAKSIKPQWMFEPCNLILTCDSCNNLKSADPTLSTMYASSTSFPKSSDAFIIFNPHFDKWSDHLQYEDEIFLVAVPNSKGQETIRICMLYRYNIIINRAKELKLEQKAPATKALHRLNNLSITSSNYILIKDELIKAVDHFIERMMNDPNFAT